jgi:hypothetical protein
MRQRRVFHNTIIAFQKLICQSCTIISFKPILIFTKLKKNVYDEIMELNETFHIFLKHEKPWCLRVFWNVLPRSQVDVDWHFRGAYCHHLQGDGPDDGGIAHCQSTSTWLHGSTSRKTLNIILATVRTRNLTWKAFLNAHSCLKYTFLWFSG